MTTHHQNHCMTLNIAEIFSDTPGGRYKKDGPKSGQEFVEFLLPLMMATPTPIYLDFKGVYGVAYSWTDEVFYTIAKNYTQEELDGKLYIINDEGVVLEYAVEALAETWDETPEIQKIIKEKFNKSLTKE